MKREKRKSEDAMANTADECAGCGKKCEKQCSRCKEIMYCSRDCQVADWRIHKLACCPYSMPTCKKMPKLMHAEELKLKYLDWSGDGTFREKKDMRTMVDEMKMNMFKSKFPNLRELFMTASKKSLWGNPKSKCLWFPAIPQVQDGEQQQQPLPQQQYFSFCEQQALLLFNS